MFIRKDEFIINTENVSRIHNIGHDARIEFDLAIGMDNERMDSFNFRFESKEKKDEAFEKIWNAIKNESYNVEI